MKNLKKSELTVIVITILCLLFTAGFFVGRGMGAQVISFEPLSSAAGSHSISETTDDAPNASMEPVSDPPAVSRSVSDDSGKININTASLTKLDELPEIGPVLAQTIIDYREKVGSFMSIEQIKNVDGIGDKTFAAMKDMITVG